MHISGKQTKCYPARGGGLLCTRASPPQPFRPVGSRWTTSQPPSPASFAALRSRAGRPAAAAQEATRTTARWAACSPHSCSAAARPCSRRRGHAALVLVRPGLRTFARRRGRSRLRHGAWGGHDAAGPFSRGVAGGPQLREARPPPARVELARAPPPREQGYAAPRSPCTTRSRRRTPRAAAGDEDTWAGSRGAPGRPEAAIFLPAPSSPTRRPLT